MKKSKWAFSFNNNLIVERGLTCVCESLMVESWHLSLVRLFMLGTVTQQHPYAWAMWLQSAPPAIWKIDKTWKAFFPLPCSIFHVMITSSFWKTSALHLTPLTEPHPSYWTSPLLLNLTLLTQPHPSCWTSIDFLFYQRTVYCGRADHGPTMWGEVH